jgi:hypothetical protein
VAVGFTPGAYDASLDVFHVTTKEAHAWPEVHVNGLGWVAFEPTPGRFEPNPTNYTGTYNPQANALQATTTTTALGSEPTPPGAATRPRAQDKASEEFNNSDGDSAGGRSPWLLALAGLIPLLLLAVALPPVLKRRRRARRRRGPNARARVAGAWSEALDRLAEAGATPAVALTPLEFAGRARAARADVGRPMDRLAGLFTKASYGSGDPSEDEARQAWEEVEVLTRALDSGDSFTGRWRRRLNPATLFTRRAGRAV